MARHKNSFCTACKAPSLNKPPKLQNQFNLTKAPKAPVLAKAAKPARMTFEKYGILSLSGGSNGSGITGDHPVRGYADLTPHWYGTGRYAKYVRSDEFKCGWASVLGDGRLVYDLYLYWGTLDVDHNHDVHVRAAVSGTVVGVGGDVGAVDIETADGDVVSLLHNRDIKVASGQSVVIGQPVATQSYTGSAAVHLHIEAANYILRPYIEGLLAGQL